MSGKATLWSIVFTLASGIYWYLVAHFFNLIGPMMLDSGPLVTRVLSEAAGMLLVYVFVLMLFFRWLMRRERR